MERLRQDLAHSAQPVAVARRVPRFDAGGLGDEVPGMRPKSPANKKQPAGRSVTRSSSNSQKNPHSISNPVSSSPVPEDDGSSDEFDVLSQPEDELNDPARNKKSAGRSVNRTVSRRGQPSSSVHSVSTPPAKSRKARPRPRPIAQPKQKQAASRDEEAVSSASNTPGRSTVDGPRAFPMTLTKPKKVLMAKDEETVSSSSNTPVQSMVNGPRNFPMPLEKTRKMLSQENGMESSSNASSALLKPLPMDLPSKKGIFEAGSSSGTKDLSFKMSDPRPLPIELPPAKVKSIAASSTSTFPMKLPSRDKAAATTDLARTMSSSSTATSSKTSRKVQRFPMNLPPQSSRDASSSQPKGKKRESPKGKERADGVERASKRLKTEKENLAVHVADEELSDDLDALGSLGSMRLDSSQSSTFSFLDEQDKELCPFCDEPWPEHPSKQLLKLRVQVERKAWKDPRYGNSKGLSAPIEVFVSLCNMHRSESRYIPEGIAQGWPTSIDFKAVPSRLRAHKKRLSRVIQDPSEVPFFQAARNDIIEKGARVAASAIGQFQSFERSQPGYYGEQGLIVILRTLDSMFPDIPPTACHPLQPADFIRQVLVPEAAIVLIKEDMKVDRSQALRILLDSRKYGLAQFPDHELAVDGESQTPRDMQRSPSPLKRDRVAVLSSTSPSPLMKKSKGKENPLGQSGARQQGQHQTGVEKKGKPRPKPTGTKPDSWLLSSSQSMGGDGSFEL